MPTIFSPIYCFKDRSITIHNSLIKLLEDACSCKKHCTLQINGINVTQNTWHFYKLLGTIRILSHTSNARVYLFKLIFYIMESKKVIIKMDINETCILENSWANYSQEIYKDWKIFHPIYSSTQVLFPKVSRSSHKYLFIRFIKCGQLKLQKTVWERNHLTTNGRPFLRDISATEEDF